MRILGLLKSDAATEAGTPPPPELFAKMDTFMQEVAKAGILESTDGLRPSSFGKRVKLADGKVSVVDGPFTESKELVASYALFKVDSMEDAVYWTTRFLEVLGEGECELRPIFEWSDVPMDQLPPHAAEQEAAWRAEMEKNAQK